MDSGMPSPELPPTVVTDPVTPVPLAKKRFGMGVLGLGTPEVKKWIEAGKGRENARSKGNGRRVGFKEMSDKEDEGGDDDDDEDPEAEETQRNLSMQISPRRVPPAWVQTASHAQTAIPSPLRTLSASPSSSSASAAHNLLRSIIADVMYDYQRETKAEMMGLHLDLVRMGRGLRKELRDVAEGGVGGLVELERLREENRLLREENERLRRGY
jgi:protein NEDD1